ncbi:MAG: M1 family metallopeptidase [Saprospiraceae bacterium]
MKNISLMLTFLSLTFIATQAQPDRWQQAVNYVMDIDFDAETNQFTGKQRLEYQNNSPDELNRVFYHLYFNAFQPGSMMDIRSRTISDPDSRVGNRISTLGPGEIGYHKIRSLKQDGKPVKYEVAGTILEVELDHPIAANSTSVFEMEFDSQVPVQIRRSGRDNAEGVDYSMAQWYPKMCEYDYQGWHANPYVGREFYGIWGDFDVTINIDKEYVVAATGYLQEPDKIGFGYAGDDKTIKHKGKKISWHFVAPNVHDFVWAADPEYTHDKLERPDGLTLHFFYIKSDENQEAWGQLPNIMSNAFDFINKTYGQYAYRQYSFIQGGDGGMEYPMATLITGGRNLGGLVGVSVHELMHSWYQMMLGTNESLYAWMDEGFTSFASSEVSNYLREKGLIPGRVRENPHVGTVMAYLQFNQSGMEEPLSVHSDHFTTNAAYSRAAYVKGAVALVELNYILGDATFRKAMLNYFDTWKFKHPNANDFIRIMEKTSGLELDWFKEYFVYTTRTADYGIKSVEANGQETMVRLEKIGIMPMPLDILVTYKDGTQEYFNIALRIMRGNKPQEFPDIKYTVLADWPWTHPEYEFVIPVSMDQVEKIEIDPSGRMADADRSNNNWQP